MNRLSVKLFISILLISTANLATADTTVHLPKDRNMTDFAACDEKAYGVVLDYIYAPSSENKNCLFIKNSLEAINRATRIAPLSTRIRLFIGPYADNNASFDMGSGLHLSHEFGVFMPSDSFSDSASYQRVYVDEHMDIIVHEYGHALFAELLDQRIPGHAAYHKKWSHISSLNFEKAKSQIKLAQSESWLEKSKLSREINRLAKEIDQNYRELVPEGKKQRQSAPALRLATLTSPYHELFADAFAVFNSNDKNAIQEALAHDRMTTADLSYHRVATRSFEDAFELSPRLSYHVPHAYFYKVRRFIGDRMWPTSDTQRKAYLVILADAIAEDIKDVMANKLPNDPEARNKGLIEKLQKHLANKQ